MCVSDVPAHVYMRHTCAHACGCRERASSPLGLALKMIVSHLLDVGDQNPCSTSALNAPNHSATSPGPEENPKGSS